MGTEIKIITQNIRDMSKISLKYGKVIIKNSYYHRACPDVVMKMIS